MPLAAPGGMLDLLFWAAAYCILHTYVIYPLLLIALDAIAQAQSAWGYLGGNERRHSPARLGLPAVSVLIAAWNEASCIGKRIENLLAQDYPADRLDILIRSARPTHPTHPLLPKHPPPPPKP